MLTPELLAALRSPRGSELLARAAALADDPFAAQRLREAGAAPELAAAAVEQVRLRLRAKARFPLAEGMWFSGPLLEQASGAVAAEYHARRFSRWERVADLCCGLGADAAALAAGARVCGVDRDPLALAITRANAEALGVGDRVELLPGELPGAAPPAPAAWVDPGRREGGRRTRQLEAISPTLPEVLSLRDRIQSLGIKLSPATAHEELDALLGAIPHEREWLSVGGECRELVVWTGELREAEEPGTRAATLLPAGESLRGVPVPIPEGGAAAPFLLEPDPAVIRSGLVGNLAVRLGTRALDPQLAYLVSDRKVESPFAAVYRVGEPEPFSLKSLAARLRQAGAGDVVLKTRGSAARPELLRQELRRVLKHGRPDCRPVVFLTRLSGRPVMIWGERFGAGSS
ncbi:MAG: class I SAM-dependent methyltransferase [Armatimonadota bacterium]